MAPGFFYVKVSNCMSLARSNISLTISVQSPKIIWYRGIKRICSEITIFINIQRGVAKLIRIMHIVLGSILTVFLILTAYNFLRLTVAPGENREAYTSGTRRFAVASLIMFVLYFLFIAVKRAFL